MDSLDAATSSAGLQRFWSHYDFVRHWKQKHFDFMQNEAHADVPPSDVSIAGIATERRPSISSYDSNYNLDNFELEIHMDSDLEEFLKKGIEYRHNRDKDKTIQHARSIPWFEKETDDYIPADKVGVNLTAKTYGTDAQKMQEEKRRNAFNLYGPNFSRILELESQLQLKFDEDFDRYQAPLWPNIPLNL